MDKEQELLKPCPFCGAKPILASDYDGDRYYWHPGIDDPCPAASIQIDSNDPEAIAAWNRRSSDEQAEVVGWQWRYVGSDERFVRYFGSGWRMPLENTERADLDASDEFETRNVYASPPAVAKGGVTDQMVEQAKAEFRRWMPGYAGHGAQAKWFTCRTDDAGETEWLRKFSDQAAAEDDLDNSRLHAALTAALSMPDEGAVCPVCAIAFKPDDMCQTDIELSTCHAACLEGSPLVDLETGDPLPEGSEWPAPYRYAALPTPPSRGEGE